MTSQVTHIDPDTFGPWAIVTGAYSHCWAYEPHAGRLNVTTTGNQDVWEHVCSGSGEAKRRGRSEQAFSIVATSSR
jgi:hypothetical protein